MFRIVLVIDMLNGNTVHAIKGERAKYKPVKSKVCDSSFPLDIVSMLLPREVYVADLDRLQGLGNNFELIKEISEKTRTMVDIGAENMRDVEKCAEIADTVILGTETASLDMIENACKRLPGKISVSIDIKNGRVLTKDKNMMLEPKELVKRLNEYHIRDIIVLELNKVGTGAGVDLEFLKEVVKSSNHCVLVGGGIRDMEEINALKEIGISGALAATAVHNGNIPLEFIM